MVKCVFGKMHQLIFRVIELFMNYFFILFFLCNELFTFPSPTQHLQTAERARHFHNCESHQERCPFPCPYPLTVASPPPLKLFPPGRQATEVALEKWTRRASAEFPRVVSKEETTRRQRSAYYLRFIEDQQPINFNDFLCDKNLVRSCKKISSTSTLKNKTPLKHINSTSSSINQPVVITESFRLIVFEVLNLKDLRKTRRKICHGQHSASSKFDAVSNF